MNKPNYSLMWLSRPLSSCPDWDSNRRDFETMGEVFRFIADLKNCIDETCDRFLYKRDKETKQLTFVQEY